ncbi:hypothetical protein BGZ96_005647, partial [Linnemannia gamsii]
ASILVTSTNAMTISFAPCNKEEGLGVIAKSIECSLYKLRVRGFEEVDDDDNWQAPEEKCISLGTDHEKFTQAKQYLEWQNTCYDVSDAKLEIKEYPRDLGIRVGGGGDRVGGRCLFS